MYASVIVPPPALLMCTKSELQLSAVGGRVHNMAMEELPILALGGGGVSFETCSNNKTDREIR